MNCRYSTQPAVLSPEEIAETLTKIAHDIRNPLAAIRASAQLGSLLAKDHQRIPDIFNDIVYNVDRVDTLLKQLTQLRDYLQSMPE